MSIENTGPGGTINTYGVRSTTTPSQSLKGASPRTSYNEFGAGGSGSVETYFRNLKASNTMKLRKSLVAGSASTGVFIGDSTTIGRAAGPDPSVNDGEYAGSYPMKAVTSLTTKGYPLSKSGKLGMSAYTIGGLKLADPRISSTGGNWQNASGSAYEYSFGGRTFMNATSTVTPLIFTFTEAFDTIKVIYVRGSGLGTFTVDVDGGTALATINTNNAVNSVASQTVSCTLGTHVLNITRTTGGTNGTVHIIGVICTNSSTKACTVINAGWGGSRVIDWAPESPVPVSAINVVPLVAADWWVINLGVNDWQVSNDSGLFRMALQRLITACKATGDVIIVDPVPSSASNAPLANQNELRNEILNAAAVNDLPLLCFRERMVDWDTAQASFFYDGAHPNAAGHADLSRVLVNMFERL